MRKLWLICFAILTGIAAIWMTMSDIVMHLVPGLPKNSVQLTNTNGTQHFHLSHSATGTAWLLWIALLIIGWRTKRWGRAQLGLALPVGILGCLPALPFLSMGGSSLRLLSHGCDWLEVLLLMVVVLVILAKLTIWRCWYQLAILRTKPKTLRTSRPAPG